jgi:nicotinamidase/pyrazinamidase
VIGYDTTTALVVVDLQNEFTDPNGTRFVAGGDSVVPRVNIEIMRAQSAGAMVVYTRDLQPESSWGAELHPGLQVAGPVVQKGPNRDNGCSAFTMRDPKNGDDTPTPLGGMLDERGIERVVVVGLALDGSVKASALDASTKYATSVVAEASAAVDREPGDGLRAIEQMREAGVEIA